MHKHGEIMRHARTLLDIAQRHGAADRVDGDLVALASSMGSDPDVARVFAGGGMSPARKIDLVRGLAASASLSPVVGRLLEILAERDELDILPALTAAYHARFLDRCNIVPAEVTTAVALAPPQADALARRLGELTGKQIQLDTRVDPSIIGGVVARVGSTVYDGSVTGQLARMRHKLVENV
jgi:F-type H+-transporting ATPase subunit delta